MPEAALRAHVCVRARTLDIVCVQEGGGLTPNDQLKEKEVRPL